MSWIGEKYRDYVRRVPKEEQINSFSDWLEMFDNEKENTNGEKSV